MGTKECEDDSLIQLEEESLLPTGLYFPKPEPVDILCRLTGPHM